MTGWAPLASPMSAFVATPLGARETRAPIEPQSVRLYMVFDYGHTYSYWTDDAATDYVAAKGTWDRFLAECPEVPVGGVLCNVGLRRTPVEWHSATPPGVSMFNRVREFPISNNYEVPNSVTLQTLIDAYRIAYANSGADHLEVPIRIWLYIVVFLPITNYWGHPSGGLHPPHGELPIWIEFMEWLRAITAYPLWGYHPINIWMEAHPLIYDARLGWTGGRWPRRLSMMPVHYPLCAPEEP